jgi:hypothetical protein
MEFSKVTLNTYEYKEAIIDPKATLLSVSKLTNNVFKEKNINYCKLISYQNACKDPDKKYLIQKPIHNVLVINNTSVKPNFITRYNFALKSLNFLTPQANGINYRRKFSIAFVLLENAQIYNKRTFFKIRNIAFSSAKYVCFLVLTSKKHDNIVCDPTISKAIYDRVSERQHNKIHVMSYYNKPKVHLEHIMLNMLVQYNRFFELLPEEIELFYSTTKKK